MEQLQINWLLVLVILLIITIILLSYNMDKMKKKYESISQYHVDLSRRFNKSNLSYIEEIKGLEASNSLLVTQVTEKNTRIRNLLECIVFLTDEKESQIEKIKIHSPEIASELSKLLKK